MKIEVWIVEAVLTFFQSIGTFFGDLFSGALFADLQANLPSLLLTYSIFFLRLILPVLGIIVVLRATRSLFQSKNEPETWAYLNLGDGIRVPVIHWENIIGRGKQADIPLPLPTISRNHAALIRSESGSWRLYDLAHKGNLLLNGSTVHGAVEVTPGDIISVGGSEMTLNELTPEEDEAQRAARTVPGKQIRPSRTLFWLSLFMLLMAGQLALAHFGSPASLNTLLSYAWLLGLMWGAWIFSRMLRRTGFEIETLAFFLCAIGLAVVSSSAPGGLFKQLLAMTIGVAGFFILGWVLRDMKRIKTLRWPAAGFAIALMLAVLAFGEEIYGAKNWITIFGFSLQPSELAKIFFIFAGAATLDRLSSRRNLYSFILFSAALVGALALMSDFGTAIIFFVVYLVIAYLRSGDLATVALSLAGAALAVVLVLALKPYVVDRFATWGNAWDFAATGGYQQTRAMIVVASGGLFGLGGGQGWLKYIAASDTDLVFAFVCEEWGMLIAVLALAALIIIACFAVRSAAHARSAYYVIAACSAAALLLFQAMLNVCGSLDILPLTGVTFPFVSNGGSSIISCWCLLAFLKAADTRQNASFAIQLPSRRKKRKEVNATHEQDQTTDPGDRDDGDSFGGGVFDLPDPLRK